MDDAGTVISSYIEPSAGPENRRSSTPLQTGSRTIVDIVDAVYTLVPSRPQGCGHPSGDRSVEQAVGR